MIRSFGDKGLENCYRNQKCASVPSELRKRILAKLTMMDEAETIADLDTPGNRLHPLKGDWVGYWAIDISGNWRMIFKASGKGKGTFDDVQYIDYH